MTDLVDTHLLLWAAGEPDKLPHGARALMEDPGEELWFSAASLWEIAIKHALPRFRVTTSRSSHRAYGAACSTMVGALIRRLAVD